MWGVGIISLCAITWLFSLFAINYKVKIALTLIIFGCLLFVPIFENHSALNLIYSFFDAPCYLCVLLAIFYIAKIYKIHNLKIKNISIIILFLFGLVYFLSVLGLLWFDMYYFGVYTQAFIMLALCALFLWLDRVMFVAITMSLIPFALQNDASFTIFDFIICPYLWLYCGVRILFVFILKLRKMIR